MVITQSFLCVQKEDMSYLRHVRRVFERLGYTVIESDWLTEWDVAWSWNYPFWGEIDLQFYDMKPHQKVGIKRLIQSDPLTMNSYSLKTRVI